MKRVIVSVVLFVSVFMLFTCGFNKERDVIGDKVKMVAQVQDLGEKITVEVLESEYTSGVHLVITPPETQYFDCDGNKISREDIEVGDKVEILYSGQVMLSYPPQIVAAKITICD